MKEPVVGEVACSRDLFYTISKVDPKGNKFWIKDEHDEELMVIRRKTGWMAENGKNIQLIS